MRSNRTVRAKLDMSKVLSFHTDSRNYGNPKPSATEAMTPISAIISYTFAKL